MKQSQLEKWLDINFAQLKIKMSEKRNWNFHLVNEFPYNQLAKNNWQTFKTENNKLDITIFCVFLCKSLHFNSVILTKIFKINTLLENETGRNQ